MKNLVYVGVIAVCIVVAAVMFLRRGGGDSGGINSLSDSEMIWVKCLKCGAGYEMSFKEFVKDQQEKLKANPSPLAMAPPLTCRECGKDGIVKAYKCEKCGEVFREGSVPNDFPDRCPKCKHSATEAKREANKAARGQG